MMKFFKKTMVAIVTMGLALSLASPFVASAECDEGCDFSQGITCSGCGAECRHESIDEETKTCNNCGNYGYCGNNLIWVIENDTLTISGSGAMADYDYYESPWEGYKNDIKNAISKTVNKI